MSEKMKKNNRLSYFQLAFWHMGSTDFPIITIKCFSKNQFWAKNHPNHRGLKILNVCLPTYRNPTFPSIGWWPKNVCSHDTLNSVAIPVELHVSWNFWAASVEKPKYQVSGWKPWSPDTGFLMVSWHFDLSWGWNQNGGSVLLLWQIYIVKKNKSASSSKVSMFLLAITENNLIISITFWLEDPMRAGAPCTPLQYKHKTINKEIQNLYTPQISNIDIKKWLLF